MALNIANRRVEAKAVEVARLIGRNKTASVEAALDFYIQAYAQQRELVKRSKQEKMRQILKRLSDRPVLDSRSPEEIRHDGATGSLR